MTSERNVPSGSSRSEPPTCDVEEVLQQVEAPRSRRRSSETRRSRPARRITGPHMRWRNTSRGAFFFFFFFLLAPLTVGLAVDSPPAGLPCAVGDCDHRLSGSGGSRTGKNRERRIFQKSLELGGEAAEDDAGAVRSIHSPGGGSPGHRHTLDRCLRCPYLLIGGRGSGAVHRQRALWTIGKLRGVSFR